MSYRCNIRPSPPPVPWGEGGIEPPLAELLADPAVHLLMRRDGVTPAALHALIAAARARLSGVCCCRCAA